MLFYDIVAWKDAKKAKADVLYHVEEERRAKTANAEFLTLSDE